MVGSTNYHVNIEILQGGFVLNYPEISTDGESLTFKREVFVTQRKLNLKIKEVLKNLSLTPDSE